MVKRAEPRLTIRSLVPTARLSPEKLGFKPFSGLFFSLNKKIIRLDDKIDNIVNFKNLILISRSAGSPDTIQIEESNGTLSTILERFNGNLILCKWDAITNQTLTLLENLFIELQDKKINIDKALVIAQRCIKNRYKEYQYWAGIEFWVN